MRRGRVMLLQKRLKVHRIRGLLRLVLFEGGASRRCRLTRRLGHHLGHRLGRGRRLAGVHCHGDEPARLFGQARAARLRRRLRGFCEGAVASSSFLGAKVLSEELVELFVVVPTEVEGGLLLSVLAEDLQVWVVVEDPLD